MDHPCSHTTVRVPMFLAEPAAVCTVTFMLRQTEQSGCRLINATVCKVACLAPMVALLGLLSLSRMLFLSNKALILPLLSIAIAPSIIRMLTMNLYLPAAHQKGTL